MKNFVKKLQAKAGYVSIETVVIAGLMIGLGALIIGNLSDAGESVATNAITKIESVIAGA